MAEDIAQWLKKIGLGQYAPAFAENGIDFDILPRLSDENLKDLGFNLGDRMRFQSAIEVLATDQPVAGLAKSLVQGTEPLLAEAERRQLTVLFCFGKYCARNQNFL